jgi:NAD(P)-dependent dehydrogenase (short-subunit alcohol dehydrogenase family)
VNAVLPGPTRSEGAVTFLDKMAADRGVRVEDHEKEFIKTNRPSSLIQRFAEPEEVATRLSISVAKPLAPPRALHYVSMVAWCGAFFSPGTKDLIAGQSLNRV